MIILEDLTLIMLKEVLLKAARNSGLVDIDHCKLEYDQNTGVIEFRVKIKEDDIIY